MSDTEKMTPAYRTADLPGLGQVQIPQGVSDAEVLAQVFGDDSRATEDSGATPAKKNKKMP